MQLALQLYNFYLKMFKSYYYLYFLQDNTATPIIRNTILFVIFLYKKDGRLGKVVLLLYELDCSYTILSYRPSYNSVIKRKEYNVFVIKESINQLSENN